MKTLKCILIAGARPNFMKIAPLLRAMERHNQDADDSGVTFEPILVHTGQHYDINMSERFFDELGIRPPDVNLEVGSGGHAEQTARVMIKLEPLLEKERPDWVIVVGDVNSTVAASLTAVKLGIKVAHVEAGLRSRDRTMPEEINRIVTDSLADLLLTPSDDGDENLVGEGVASERIRQVGNIMIDTLVANLESADRSPVGDETGVGPGQFAYVTLHRPSNVDERDRLQVIMDTLGGLSEQIPIVFPVHPRTRTRLEAFGIVPPGNGQFRMVEPVGYHASTWLCRNARLVLTDSGGLQEEATYFRTPCLTLRPNTERPITITQGSNRLTDVGRMAADLEDVLQGPARIGQCPELWDGRTGERVVEALVGY